MPEDFANLKIINIMADQNSASHPYNALIIPRLSEAYKVGFVDNAVFPSNGFSLNADLSHLIKSSKDERVTQFSADAKFYFRLINSPRTVIATRIGYQRSFGDLQFYQYADLGNSRGLRGFRNERFRGESAFYQNIDLRLKLFSWNNNILPMDVGILGGYDYGKVYLNDEKSETWNDGRTVGLWFELLGTIVVQPYYSFNDDLNTISLKVGFNF